jgi:hypothetical protein
MYFLTLAELYNKKRSKPLGLSRRSDRRRSSLIDPDSLPGSKTPGMELKGAWEQGGKDCYLAWCMVKSALKTTSARQVLQGFASAANNLDLIKSLTERVRQDLPDFVLLDLYPQCKSLETLTNKPVLLPVESLLPSRQYRPKVKLNWFKIISYYNRLVQRCSWQKASLGLQDSNWGLHYNHMTPLVFTKAKAVHSFLCTYCPHFRTSVIPTLPQPTMLPSGAANVSTLHREPHLTAGEMDATVIWYANPMPPSLFTNRIGMGDDAEVVPISDRITGYFAMNMRSVSFPVQCEPHLLGIETHMVHTSLKKLSALHEQWKEMGKDAAVYLDSKSSMRPISRSVSKQKRADKNIQPPEELLKNITKAVKEVASFFESKAKEVSTLHN